MPELPEVETMRSGIVGAVGSRVVDVEKMPCARKPIEIRPSIETFRRRVVGSKIDRLDRAGKRVVIWLDSDDAIVIEPRMTGLVLKVDPPTKEHLRLRIRLHSGPIRQILYWDRRGLGNVRLMSERTFRQRLGPNSLGPDALNVTVEQIREHLDNSQRAIKVALLDQRAVAGIGNLYASEILHLAGIHPGRKCHRMSLRQWQTLVDATHRVLEEAIRYEGSTLGDGTYRNALNQQGTYQTVHRVYNKAGNVCPSCGQAEIVRIVQAQRSTFFCPKCQRKAGFSSSSKPASPGDGSRAGR